MENSSAYEAGQAVGRLIAGGVMIFVFLAALGFFIFALVKACTRKTTGWIVTTVIMGVVGIGLAVTVVAGLVIGIAGAAKKAKVDQVLTSADGRHTLSVPGSWKSMPELNEVASIESGNAYADRYAILIVEDRKDADPDLTDYADYSANEVEEMVTDAAIGEPESTTVAGFPAIKHRVTGIMNNHKVTYIHTAVKTPTSLCRILCWGLSKDEQAADAVFDKVISSFAEKPQ